MFFIAKSALCIGIVTVLAAGVAGSRDIRTSLESRGGEAAASLGRACAASRKCVGLGSRLASVTIGQAGTGPALLAGAGIASLNGALPFRQAPTSSVRGVSTGSPPRHPESHIRGTAAARD